MERITRNFKHDYDNDTTIEYFNTGLYSGLNCSYTSEDPDYGTDTIHFACDHVETIEKLASDMLKELTEYLDWKDGKIESTEYSYEYSNSTLYAIENALKKIVGVNMNGHKFMIGNARKAAKLIQYGFANKKLKAVYVGADICNISENFQEGYNVDLVFDWHKIVRVDLPFDNTDDEIMLMMGYCGGGGVSTAYTDGSSDDEPIFLDRIMEMIVKSTGELADTELYFEFIGVNDEHTYERNGD